MVLDPLGSILRKVEIAGPDRSGANQLFASGSRALVSTTGENQ